MATFAQSAPLSGSSTLVGDPVFQEDLQRSRSLTDKMLRSIPDTHKSCIHIKTLQLNSSENAKFQTMASTIGIPSAPLLKPLSENFILENTLTRIYEGLQLHQALLDSIVPKLEVKDKVNDLKADIRDLGFLIRKLLKLVRKDAVVQQTPTPVELRLPGDYEVQVAAHLTLVQLQAFGDDVDRCLRSLAQTDKEAES
ncbi:colony stimulating factor 3 (granulocyte) a isoform X2 [Melanotaenia boesemani]|nr:colony stimulating factor 3 (granulocyte) a isoform X2 [Melanotaenia boesemani]